MDRKKLLFWAIITMIVLLLFVDLRIGMLSSKFQKDCSLTYDVNGSCRCPHPKYESTFDGGEWLNISANLSGINFSKAD
jgi:hypothetical protein